MSQTELDVVAETNTEPKKPADTRIFAWLALALPAATVILVYVLLRWAPSPVGTAVVVGGLLLLALSVVGYFGVRRGVIAPFVAVALVLPYLVLGAGTLGSASRVSDELEDWLRDGSSDSADELFDSSADESFDDEGEEGVVEGEGEGAGEVSYAELAVPAGSTGYFEGFAVTVDSLECGVESVPNAAENPEYWESDDAPEYIAATPEKGKTFCVVESTWVNDSQQPESRSSYETLTGLIDAEGNQYAKSEDDEAYSEAATDAKGYDVGTLNPGDSASIVSVFSMPADVEVTHIVAQGYAFDSEELVYFEAP